ncbi:Crp/Fnr family transcriptional regulator [Amycolatopsis nigrescens]|uniref:Crp/Fnr family transcriptional regulator n=1 Tax=Amycolatopsis nigrescens TaxID=381445 RepID=UPI001FDF9BE4|nr:cyclic nucleotide-binding domain-containing protein [Amycolatopsis nigrescens]
MQPADKGRPVHEKDLGFPSYIADLSIFKTLTPAEIRQVLRAGRRVTLPSGWPLISEETPGDLAYIVLEGTVSVWLGRTDVAELGPGSIIGETALRESRLRTATVSAVTAVRVLRLDGAALAGLTQRLPTFASAVEAQIAARSSQG